MKRIIFYAETTPLICQPVALVDSLASFSECRWLISLHSIKIEYTPLLKVFLDDYADR